MNKKGNTSILIILILIALGVGAYFYFSNSGGLGEVLKPQLSTTGVTFESSFSLSKGCATQVEGYVSNAGSANAESVSVNCKLIGSSEGSTTGSKTLGSIAKGGNSYFSMGINNDCPSPDDVQCSTSCSNC